MRRVKRVATIILAAVFIFAGAVSAREVYGLSSGTVDFYTGNALLEEWRIPEARAFVDDLMERTPEDTSALLLDGHVRFFEGDYKGALKRLDEVGVTGAFRELVKVTSDIAAGFKSRSSEHFEIFWENPKDEVLAEPALEGLEASYSELSKLLGFRPEGRVRVEIYPTVADFTAVSTLTREEVETSGTIGLCKFNRLMITSPRATFFGYRWRDTLCHEFAHLAVFRLSGGNAPIWIHEGLARYFEGSWRGRSGRMTPFALNLLSKRYSEGTLIPLDKMSPSVAKLPSAEDTSLAFAEVGTMVSYLIEHRGGEAPRRLLAQLAEGRGDREAFSEVWGGTFASFEEEWRQWVEKLSVPAEDLEVMGIALKDSGGEPEQGKIPDPEAKDYTRLGDMLRTRGRMEAASVEYEKGFRLLPDNPAVVSKYALGRIFLGEYQAALDAVAPVISLYEDRSSLWMRKGEALLALERYDEAASAFNELMEINPFDEPGRVGLVRALSGSGREEEHARAVKDLELITGGAPSGAHP
ncbi:MAG: hypothetical protein C0609_07850 [Deltaproteobacteria bacterium]|nr:MAG: hypothetical protein C0609_07850 [Deltaproteobacteria bacterium]